jgi:hypothetical protein
VSIPGSQSRRPGQISGCTGGPVMTPVTSRGFRLSERRVLYPPPGQAPTYIPGFAAPPAAFAGDCSMSHERRQRQMHPITRAPHGCRAVANGDALSRRRSGVLPIHVRERQHAQSRHQPLRQVLGSTWRTDPRALPRACSRPLVWQAMVCSPVALGGGTQRVAAI